MRWPWSPRKGSATLVLAPAAHGWRWLRADGAGAALQVQRCGHVAASDGASAAAALRAQAPGLGQVLVLLPLAQAQLLQIEAPAVPPEELRAAARWRIKDLVDGAVDDCTIDVMPVGAGASPVRGARQLFVAAAANAAVREAAELAHAAGLPLAVIDIAETAQRNLQAAASAAAGLGGRATAALVRHGPQCLLTVVAAGELYEARRLDAALLDTTVAAHAASGALATAAVPATLGEDWDYVDYGADPAGPDAADAGAEKLVLELQRSFDVWERSQPELPLAALWLQLGPDSAALAPRLARALGLRTEVLDATALLPGAAAALAAAPDAGGDPAEAWGPLLGALLRVAPRHAERNAERSPSSSP